VAIANYDKCGLILPFNEANDATTFVDYSPAGQSIAANGNAKISTASGSPRLRIDGGSNSCVRITGDRKLNPGSGDFGIAFRYQKLGSPQSFARLFQTRDGDLTCGIALFIDTGTSENSLYLAMSSNGSSNDIKAQVVATLHATNEQHIELDKVGTTVTLYIDGVSAHSFTSSATPYFNINDTWILGGQTGTSRSVNGYIRDFQAVSGASLHTAAFTPDAAGSLVKTLSGNVKDDADANAARVVQAISRQSYGGRPVAFSTTSDGTTGNYSLKVPDIGSEEWTRLFLDDASGTVYNDLVLGRGTPV
jgi:hypothetical protein